MHELLRKKLLEEQGTDLTEAEIQEMFDKHMYIGDFLILKAQREKNV
jgi:hypothetical protein